MFNIIHGLIMTLMEFLVRGFMFSGYLYIHANYCLVSVRSKRITWKQNTCVSTPCPGTPPGPGWWLAWPSIFVTTGSTGQPMVSSYLWHRHKIIDRKYNKMFHAIFCNTTAIVRCSSLSNFPTVVRVSVRPSVRPPDSPVGPEGPFSPPQELERSRP